MPTEAILHARSFLQHHARALEWALYRHQIEGADAAPVITELAAYRNADGGFGHALEPDVQCPASSVLATTTALQTLRALRCEQGHSFVKGAIGFLLQSLNPATLLWPMLSPAFAGHAHAPWWTPDCSDTTNADRWGLNPRAEALAHLLTWPAGVPADLIDRLGAAVLAQIDQRPAKMEMHELLCCLRLLDAANLPAAWRSRLLDRLLPAVEATVERDPAKWEGYCLTPLDVLDRPDSPFAPMLTQPLCEQLNWLLPRQLPDGSWPVGFSWGEGELAKVITQQWRGVKTLRILLAMHRFGVA